MAGNYDKQVVLARELFLKYDQSKMIEKFHLQADEAYLYLTMLGQDYRISRKEGIIEDANSVCLDFNAVMTVYDVLCCSADQPLLVHQWVTQGSLQAVISSPNADMFTPKYAKAFSGRIEQLKKICGQFAGRKPELAAGADVAYEFDMFPFFSIQFRFWEADEEFPAQIKLLWDKNTLDFMHFETTYYAMNLLLGTLEKKIQED